MSTPQNNNEHTNELDAAIVEKLPISCDIPSKTEITAAIRTLKDKRVPGVDNIPAEFMKANYSKKEISLSGKTGGA